MTPNKPYVLVKLNTGENLVGCLLKPTSKKSIRLERPMTFATVPMVNQIGMKVNELLVLKMYNQFSSDDEVSISMDSIISTMSADSLIVGIYEKEKHRIDILKTINPMDMLFDNKQQSDSNPFNDMSDPMTKIMGNLNLNFAFDDPENFQNFLENLQMGMEGLTEEIDNELDFEDDEDEDLDLEDDVDSNSSPSIPPKKKKAKNRIAPKEGLELPYEKDGDPTDPKSWSNDPKDYL